jgi:hypothetical protein
MPGYIGFEEQQMTQAEAKYYEDYYVFSLFLFNVALLSNRHGC